MDNNYYYGRSKNIESESVNESLENNKKRFTDLMYYIHSHARRNPQTELSNRYFQDDLSYYHDKFKKERTNSINLNGLYKLIDFFSYLLKIETQKSSINPVEIMYGLMNECYEKYYEDFRARRFSESIDDRLMDIIHSDVEAEQVEEGHGIEGNVKYYYGKRYERDSKNRRLAINIHGLVCFGCGFNFEKVYGDRGKDFIEIHHNKPLSTLEEAVEINPETDLVPLCANCHRMVHRRKDDILSIEELKQLILEHKML